MEDLFELITVTGKDSDKKDFCIGVRVKLSGYETVCPVTRNCESYEALEMEIESFKNQLDHIQNRAKDLARGSASQKGLNIKPQMGAKEIWSILSNIPNEEQFVEGFNNLDEAQRKEVAEYVLTHCNIFSGDASIFSSRYDSSTGLLD